MSDDPKQLNREQLDWLSDIVAAYRDDHDWTHPEWNALQDILDKVDAQLDTLE